MKIEVKNTQQNEQVDWTKNPQLVVSDYFVVLVYKNQKNANCDGAFVGIRLDEHQYSNDWDKSQFKPFHGKITLSND